jgi:imidazole glycerol-phosphate synthase subunit HisF
MLKVRIIPCLLFKERTIVKSRQFDSFRMVGDPTTVARVFNERNADELIFLDIMASREGKPPNFKVIGDLANECFMPLTIGGGIRDMDDVDRFFRSGADKISINTAAIEQPEFISSVARKYGSQAVVVSIDVKRIGNRYQVWKSSGKIPTGLDPISFAQSVERLGAGEILLNSIDQDGMQKGYDIDLITQVSSAVKIPVIAAGGCGTLQHFVDAVQLAGADAVSAASIFYYVGESIITAKQYMQEHGLAMRIR